ncbi:MAG: bifunctional 5,10-methylenetetrahydrofolate dehydrogenase/5,10-methenyltetrahydrofolate cyclohydrolase [Alphaproteobacteria bacterium]|nr:bifunctional 5,10-methylenetetrahydrofolate dehydrogenase/5,10-methenyltetrahydrofolate cyclohydrolase [Alphaproteobacteria bacterium]MDY4689940.1 bifunctional 5,10-methylenetetrahydrofolate dehydrogenase/5,10-methenyltetrahydrofolate cyclohydrolase [Alphaproteobacteria bacterium]
MTARIIDGKKIAAGIREKLKQKIAALPSAPQLAIVLVGNDEPSLIYVRNKQKAAAQIGLLSQLHHLDENISEEELLKIIAQLNADSEINGIIVQLPLPKHLNTNRIINAISPLKDVDGFHPYNTGMLQNNEKPYFIAATPLGVMQLIKSVSPNLSGKNVVLIGASLIVGRPLATLLLNQECTVSITHAQTRKIKELTSKADILVAACGVAKLVKADWIKENAILIDVGINRKNGKLCGDIDFEDVKEKALAITPVPGGVGPMTIAMLLSNTVDAYLLHHPGL